MTEHGPEWSTTPQQQATIEQVKHVLLDAIIAAEIGRADGDTEGRALGVAFQRLDEIRSISASFDPRTRALILDPTCLIAGAMWVLGQFARDLATYTGDDVEGTIANVRARIEEPT